METTYLLHHCKSQALEGLINSLPLLATSSTIDAPLRELAKKLYDGGRAIWDNYQAEKMRSNLGLRGASEIVLRQDNLLGKSRALDTSPKFSPDVLQAKSGPASGIITRQSSDWEKLIWNGQEFHAYAYLPSGCYAVVRLKDKNIHRIARICHITQTTTVTEAPEHIEERIVVLVCELFSPVTDDTVEDMWAKLHLGFLVQRSVEVGFYHLFLDNVVSGVVLTPTIIGPHHLLVAVPHDKVRHYFPSRIARWCC